AAVWNRAVVAAGQTQTRFRPIPAGPITVKVQMTDTAGAPAVGTREVGGGPGGATPPNPAFTALQPAPASPALPPGVQQSNSISASAQPAPATTTIPPPNMPAPALQDTAPAP